ncbi:hypothetical protein [Gloeobacter violaceus]|nr:hypothetical protein [Gloeobacter violaceus]
MLLRGSFDFASVAEYQTLIDEVIDRLNALHQSEFESERVQLSALPDDRYADYRVVLTKVSSSSTVCVRCILYSVPSQLMGHTLRIHLYHDRLVGYLGCRQVFSLERVYVAADCAKRRARSIDYRHVIDSLHKKPRAFASCQYRDELLPDGHYRQLWSRMVEQFDRDMACKLMVSALYLAAKLDCQAAVGAYLESELSRGTLSLSRLRSRFEARQEIVLPHSSFDQHSLADYDALLPTSCGSAGR